MKKRRIAVIIIAAMLLSAVPVFGAEEDLLELKPVSVEEDILSTDEPIASEEIYTSVATDVVVDTVETVSMDEAMPSVSTDKAEDPTTTTKGEEDPENPDEYETLSEDEAPVTDIEGTSATIIYIGDNEYYVSWTAEVEYDDRAHVWSEIEVPSKDWKKKVADVEVEIECNGETVDPSDYSITTKNNKHVTGVNGNKKYQPFFTISLGGEYKKDRAEMLKKHMPFDIVPCPIDSGEFLAKKVVVKSSGKVIITKLLFVFDDGRKVKLNVYNPKKGTGSYRAEDLDYGSILIEGYNNFCDSQAFVIGDDDVREIIYKF